MSEASTGKRKLSLAAWIFIGMFAGIAAGIAFNMLNMASFTTRYIKPFGTIYINLLKFLVVPVVLLSIANGVVSLKDLKRVGSIGVKTFLYYMLTTALAVVIGLFFANLFKAMNWFPKLETTDLIYEAKTADLMQTIVNIFPSNALTPLVNADMLPLIVSALFLGAGILSAGEHGKRIGQFVEDAYEVTMKILMFGWEFPPHITGGLGTACYGLTKGLSEIGGLSVTFVVPKAWGDEDQSAIRLVRDEAQSRFRRRNRSRVDALEDRTNPVHRIKPHCPNRKVRREQNQEHRFARSRHGPMKGRTPIGDASQLVGEPGPRDAPGTWSVSGRRANISRTLWVGVRLQPWRSLHLLLSVSSAHLWDWPPRSAMR